MTLRGRIFIFIAIAITVAIVVVVGLRCFSAQLLSSDSRGVAMVDLPKLYPPENKALGEIVIKTYREYRANTARWSFVYFTCIFGSAVLSAMAALILKLELLQAWPRLRNDAAATSAVVAALLITLSTTGDFQRKWHANRMAAAGMENLAYALATSKTPEQLDGIIAEIRAINDARNRGIVGEAPAAAKPSTQTSTGTPTAGAPSAVPAPRR